MKITAKNVIILSIIALVIRAGAILYWQFDGLYGQDPFAYLQQAIAITENLPQGRPPPADFFWPNGYPLLIAFFMVLTGPTALAGQLAALLCGTLLAPLAYLLTKDLLPNSNGFPNHGAGLLAGLIIAVAGQPILSSIVIMADMPALFWAALSAWLVVRALNFRQEGERAEEQGSKCTPAPLLPCPPAWWFLAAGATLALAIITRWLYILIVPALILYALFKLWVHKRLWWTPLPAVLSGTLILAPQVWISLNKPEGLYHSWLLGWHPANFFLRQFENIDGHFSYPLPVGIFYAQPAGHPAYIFPLLGLASLWGAWRLWRAQQWGPLILLFGWIIPVYLFLGGIPYQNFRFGLTLYLPLVILTGFGLNELLRLLTKPFTSFTPLLPRPPAPLPLCSPAPRPLRPAALLIITLSLLAMPSWAYPMVNNFVNAQNYGKRIVQQVEQALPPQATLLTFGLTLTFQHYTSLNTLELFYFDEASLNELIGNQNEFYLLLDLHNIETQWQGRTPQHNYQWLKKNTELTKIESFPPYTLLQVKRGIFK